MVERKTEYSLFNLFGGQGAGEKTFMGSLEAIKNSGKKGTPKKDGSGRGRRLNRGRGGCVKPQKTGRGGWRQESARHGLAAKGIETGHRTKPQKPKLTDIIEQKTIIGFLGETDTNEIFKHYFACPYVETCEKCKWVIKKLNSGWAWGGDLDKKAESM